MCFSTTFLYKDDAHSIRLWIYFVGVLWRYFLVLMSPDFAAARSSSPQRQAKAVAWWPKPGSWLKSMDGFLDGVVFFF